MGPSAIDLEIRGLGVEDGGSEILLYQFLKFIEYLFNSRKNYELAQSYLGLFLQVIQYMLLLILSSFIF